MQFKQFTPEQSQFFEENGYLVVPNAGSIRIRWDALPKRWIASTSGGWRRRG